MQVKSYLWVLKLRYLPFVSCLKNCTPFHLQMWTYYLSMLPQRDTPAQIKGIGEFLGRKLTQEQIETLCESTSIDTMRAVGKGACAERPWCRFRGGGIEALHKPRKSLRTPEG